ncbi:MAG: uroporphyrinogen decarboxylase family protein [Spirochaetales bacterium]|uniref:Uroporphyrinogen decarboxylase family protein n=1 Tax=Candidatus Thalassospirochaeta sargassi TaxID=3119039 RepID=A0AAJ1ICF8_9SPIO|nr:uroporphyrinogen decarboxylase family protein [Spirochaetales bacterium]
MREMTGLERCKTVLDGDLADFVPVVPQTFMFAAETAGFKIGDIARDGRKMAESHVISQEKYGYDGCVIDIDDATLAEACGAKVLWDNPDEPAVIDEHNPAVTDLRQFEDMEIPDPLSSARLPVWLEATRSLVDRIGDRIFVMGRADQGPFDLLCLLRGTQNFMMELITEPPEIIWKALDWCREANLAFAKAIADEGAHATSIGDAYAGPNLIHPDMYRQFALEHEITLSRQVREYGIPWSMHICGDTTAILEDMAKTRAKIIELDWQVDMAEARGIFPDDVVLMGNIDPSYPLAHGTPNEVTEKVIEIINGTRGRGLFLSSGCAMGRNTRPENMKAMVAAAKTYGSRERLLEL